MTYSYWNTETEISYLITCFANAPQQLLLDSYFRCFPCTCDQCSCSICQGGIGLILDIINCSMLYVDISKRNVEFWNIWKWRRVLILFPWLLGAYETMTSLQMFQARPFLGHYGRLHLSQFICLSNTVIMLLCGAGWSWCWKLASETLFRIAR